MPIVFVLYDSLLSRNFDKFISIIYFVIVVFIHIFLRPGQVIVFQIPGASTKASVEVGMVLTVWKGVKAPKQFGGPVPVGSCCAFRAVALDVEDPDQDASMTCFLQMMF